MKWAMNHALMMTVGLALGASLLLAGGCAPPRENLVTTGKVVVETQSLSSVRVSRVDVYQDGEGLVVDGYLRRSSSCRQRSMGHIDVAVLGPDGAISAQENFRDSWKHCAASTFIWTRLPLLAPKGSAVRVLYHDSRRVAASGHTSEEWESLWKAASRT